MPDGKAVDAGQSASHVGCISNSQATRSDDESRSVVEGRAHHDDDEERPRRLTVEPSMLGYARGIGCSPQQAAHHDVQPQEESPTRRRRARRR